MGMFDTIMLNVTCLHCNTTAEMECQTKDLECACNVYHPRDYIGTDQFNYIHATAGCKSKTCMEWEEKKYKGRIQGFGYTFPIKVLLNNGIITGEYKYVTE